MSLKQYAHINITQLVTASDSCSEKILISGQDAGLEIIGIYERTKLSREGKPVWEAKKGNNNKRNFIYATQSGYWHISGENDFYTHSANAQARADYLQAKPCPIDLVYSIGQGNNWTPFYSLHVRSYKG